MDENKPMEGKMEFLLNKKRPRDTEDDKEVQNILQTSNGVKKASQQRNSFSPLKQYEYIKKLILNGAEGKTEYMLARPWYVSWEKYCLELTRISPNGINNSTLLREDGSLKLDLTRENDYMVIPESAWVILVKCYGLLNPSFMLVKKNHSKKLLATRKPIPKNIKPKRLQAVPIIPPGKQVDYHFSIYRAYGYTERRHTFTISPKATVSKFQNSLLNALDLTSGTDIELWLLNSQLFKNNTSFFIAHHILNNPKSADYIDSYKIDLKSTISSYLSMTTSSSIISEKNEPYYFHLAVDFINKKKISPNRNRNGTMIRGLCGLQNLGNTCYMNSAIQCLSNTPQLAKWFLNQDYKKDINSSNPLGLNGDLAEAFSFIINTIWKQNTFNKLTISPKHFKSTFERFNPHFIGYQQHDSQEFLSFLLDGLHEDLNRILKKPYIELPDFDDLLSDRDIATCFWNYHKARNDSVIVDLFQGQFKSRLTCDECKKVSVTFDPFMYLSLPLPNEAKSKIDVIYIPYLPSQRQLKMSIHLNKDAKINQLKQEIENNITSSSFSVYDNYSLLVVEMHQGNIFKIFSDTDPIDTINFSDRIHVYQLPCQSTPNQDWIIFPVYCSTTMEKEQTAITTTQFGFPILLAIEAKKLTSLNDIYGTIVHHIERYCIVKLFEEDLTFTAKNITQEIEKEEQEVFPLFQQPIHTTAAVTAAGGRPMVPMPNLFNIRVFDRQTPFISKSQLNIPTGCSVHWSNDQAMIKQGQGIVLEWSLSKAQQVFGNYSSSSKSSKSKYDHDQYCDINTEAWREYEEFISNKKTVKSRMTSRSVGQTSMSICTLEDCLEEFTGDEKLSSEDLWYCPRCKKHQRASKKFDIWKLPEILVVHLKRFSQERTWGNKIDMFIDFPIQGLDMTDRVLSSKDNNEELIYDLYAIDNHYGGLVGGHYTAYAQNVNNRAWYNFDDSHVSEISINDIKTRAAYLLFYKRRI